jgi:hypothetical protein
MLSRLYYPFLKDSNSEVCLYFLLALSLLQAIIYDQHNIERETKKEKTSTKHSSKKGKRKRHLLLATRHRKRGEDEGLMAGRFWRFHGMGWGSNWSRGQ